MTRGGSGKAAGQNRREGECARRASSESGQQSDWVRQASEPTLWPPRWDTANLLRPVLAMRGCRRKRVNEQVHTKCTDNISG